MLIFSFTNQTKNRTIKSDFFRRILKKSLKYLKLDKSKIVVNLSLVSENEIRKLNREYRGKDKPTDVLSFPFAMLKLGLKERKIFWGDIFICLSIAEKSRADKVSLKEILSKLSIHGFLHLAGYDHERSKKDREKMEKLEKKLWREAISLSV